MSNTLVNALSQVAGKNNFDIVEMERIFIKDRKKHYQLNDLNTNPYTIYLTETKYNNQVLTLTSENRSEANTLTKRGNSFNIQSMVFTAAKNCD